MKVIVLIIALFGLSQQANANCMTPAAQEMTYYIYLDEKDLVTEYCICDIFYKAKMTNVEEAKEVGLLNRALEELDKAGIISTEMSKISRVLKKDHGILEKDIQCPKES